MILQAGLLLWIGAHLMKALDLDLRRGLIQRLGYGPYRGLFALIIVTALVLIVLGWKSTSAASVWAPPSGLRHATMALMWFAAVLFVSARLPSDIKRKIRHPQLTAVKIWALAHLLSNGEVRSLWLFGSLLAWAVLEVIFINRRDGPRTLPEAVGLPRTLLAVAVGTVLYGLLVFGHPWLAGVRLF